MELQRTFNILASNLQAYVCEGDVFMAMDKFDAAEESYSIALDLEPSIRRAKSFKVPLPFTYFWSKHYSLVLHHGCYMVHLVCTMPIVFVAGFLILYIPNKLWYIFPFQAKLDKLREKLAPSKLGWFCFELSWKCSSYKCSSQLCSSLTELEWWNLQVLCATVLEIAKKD